MTFTNRQVGLAGLGLLIGGAFILRSLSDHPRVALRADTKPARPVEAGTPEPFSTAPHTEEKMAIKKTGFRIRMRETAHSEGPQAPAGMRLTLLEESRIRRGEQTLWQVRTPRGTVGWTFITRDELVTLPPRPETG